jgi:predicted ArsR family transcriptional regulator
VTLLRKEGLTVDDIASALALTANAVRAQIAAMERDGVVHRVGLRPGTTRPSHVFALTAEVEQLLSQAYLPFLTRLVRVFSNALPPEQVDILMRTLGKEWAAELSVTKSPGSLRARVLAASELLNDQLGAVTHVERNGGYVIRGMGCPLAALTGKHPAVCLAMESLLTEIIGAGIHECCDRAERPKCCFEIDGVEEPRHTRKARSRSTEPQDTSHAATRSRS